MEKIYYLNNSATSFPKPGCVAAAMQEALSQPPMMRGRGEESGAADRVAKVREQVATFFGCPDASRLIFGSNATDGLNLAIHGLIERRDMAHCHVVTTTNDHNSALRPLRTLEARGLIELTIVASDKHGTLDANRIVDAFQPKTRLLVINHLSNVTGVIAPIAELCDICRARGITTLVDAAQSAGVLDINVATLKADLLAFTGHKYLMGPTGIGGLYIGEGVELIPRKQGGTGVRSEYPFQPDDLPIRYESGTINYVGIIGLEASIGYLADQGLENVRSKITELRRDCEKQLLSLPGIKVYGPGLDAEKGPTISFAVAGRPVEEVGDLLRNDYGVITRTGLHCAPLCHKTIGTGAEGTIRVSFSSLTNGDCVDALINGLKKIIAA